MSKKNTPSPRRRPGRDAEETIAKAERLVADAEILAHEKEPAQTSFPVDESSVEEIDLHPAEEATDSFDTPVYDADENHDSHQQRKNTMNDSQNEHDEAKVKKESPFKNIHVQILGKELLNIETPEVVVEIADSVVDQWKKDGDFSEIPLKNPLAQALAAKGLRKAKDIEKKLEEKGVFAMAQMGLSVLKSKLKK